MDVGIASGKTDEGVLVRRLRVSETPARVEYKFNPNHDPENGQFTFGSGSEGAKLTPEAKAVADRIGRDFFLRTGKRVQVNSGTRPPKSRPKPCPKSLEIGAFTRIGRRSPKFARPI